MAALSSPYSYDYHIPTITSILVRNGPIYSWTRKLHDVINCGKYPYPVLANIIEQSNFDK